MSQQNPYAAPDSFIGEPELPSGSLPYASRFSRFIASLIDGLILIVVLMLALWAIDPNYLRAIFNPAEAGAIESGATGMGAEILITVGTLVAQVAINWVFLKNGQTIGKLVMGIQIQRILGGLFSPMELVIKRFLPVYLVGNVLGLIHPVLESIGGVVILLDLLLIFRRGHNTWHDDIAGSKVVRLPR